MYQTLYIDLPVVGRETYRGVIASLVHYGFQFVGASGAATERGLRVTAIAAHCTGDVTAAAGELVCTLPQGSTIEIDIANPFH